MHKKFNQYSDKKEFKPNELSFNISKFVLAKGEQWIVHGQSTAL